MADHQGDQMAQNNLGIIFDKGQGVPENDREAVRWYQMAADQGNASAQNTCLIGICPSKVGYLRRILAVKVFSCKK